jgi:hypothetical protein
MAKSGKGPGRPKTKLVEPVRAAAKGTKEGEERYIILAKTELVGKMKDIAYWDRMPIKEVFEEAMVDRVKKYEKKSGPLKPQPNKG